MTAKGLLTGNDAADRILRGEVPVTRHSLRRVIAAERNRTLAAVRGRLDRALTGYIGDPRPAVRIALDEMEEAAE